MCFLAFTAVIAYLLHISLRRLRKNVRNGVFVNSLPENQAYLKTPYRLAYNRPKPTLHNFDFLRIVAYSISQNKLYDKTFLHLL